MYYNVQCTLYARMNVHLKFKKNLSQMFQNYSELYLAVPPWSHPPPTLQAALPPPPQRKVPEILICYFVTCRKILDLKK